MLSKSKQIQKLRNYWLNDSEFRHLIYSVMNSAGKDWVQFMPDSRSNQETRIKLSRYSDLLSLNLSSTQDNIYAFLHGWLFQTRDSYFYPNLYYKLGRELSMDGLVFQLTKLYLSDETVYKDWNKFYDKVEKEIGPNHPKFKTYKSDFENDVAAFHLGAGNKKEPSWWPENQIQLLKYGQDLCQSQICEKMKEFI